MLIKLRKEVNMALVRPTKMLEEAKRNGKAVPAFNVLSLEMIQGVIAAAEQKNKPVILQVSTGAMKWAKFEYMVPMILSAAKHAKVDVAVHLDHCQDVDLIKRAVEAGFPSVMYDGSHFDLETNIANSRAVMEFCKGKADVEVEIGKVGGKEDDLVSDANDSIAVEDAISFHDAIKPDMLAVAFGTAHGIYSGEINLDIDLIAECAKRIETPLVMHGTSGVPFEDIKRSIRAGVVKINVGTDLLVANFTAIRKFLAENPKAYDIRKINTAGMNAITARAVEYFDLFEGV